MTTSQSGLPGRRKTLLLTDIPPCSNLTAGIVTAQMCRFVPRGELAIFCVMNKHLTPELCPDLADIPMRTIDKPSELGRRTIKSVKVGWPGAAAIEAAKRFLLPPRLAREAVAYGRAQGVDSVWAVLQGQTMVRLALPVAQGLGVPLRSHIWDPLGWWLRAHGVDPANTRLDQRLFEKTMRASVSCAAASPQMADAYRAAYGVAATPVIASIDRNVSRQPATRLLKPGEVSIAMVGQFYASQEWGQFVHALNLAGWQVAGRKVILRTFGHQPPPSVIPDGHLEFMGWKNQTELIDTIARTCDITYCPYPSEPDMAEVARLSFPSKVPTYLAAGKPILFHGPDYASPALYLRANAAGVLCRDLYASSVYNGLALLVEDTDLYARTALAAQKAFLDDFTLEVMERNVRKFLGYDPAAALAPSINQGVTPL